MSNEDYPDKEVQPKVSNQLMARTINVTNYYQCCESRPSTTKQIPYTGFAVIGWFVGVIVNVLGRIL